MLLKVQVKYEFHKWVVVLDDNQEVVIAIGCGNHTEHAESGHGDIVLEPGADD